MIDKSQLRIGNLVDYAGQISKVLAINGIEDAQFDTVHIETDEECEYTEFFNLEPIKLTEHWLRNKFHLEEEELGYYKLTEEININVDGQVYARNNHTSIWISEHYHVHSLMNFYHSLTGEELTISM